MQFFNPVNEQKDVQTQSTLSGIVLFRMMHAQFSFCGDEFSDYTCVQFDLHFWRGRTMRSTFGHVYKIYLYLGNIYMFCVFCIVFSMDPLRSEIKLYYYYYYYYFEQ